MDIKTATIAALKAGCAITRTSWKQPESWVKPMGITGCYTTAARGDSAEVLSGSRLQHWQPRMSELLADDWELTQVETVPVTERVQDADIAGHRKIRGGLDIRTAVKMAAEAGHTVTRYVWAHIWAHMAPQMLPTDSDSGCVIYTPTKVPIPRWEPSARDLIAEDWMIVF